jgi:hypothetical protein
MSRLGSRVSSQRPASALAGSVLTQALQASCKPRAPSRITRRVKARPYAYGRTVDIMWVYHQCASESTLEQARIRSCALDKTERARMSSPGAHPCQVFCVASPVPLALFKLST